MSLAFGPNLPVDHKTLGGNYAEACKWLAEQPGPGPFADFAECMNAFAKGPVVVCGWEIEVEEGIFVPMWETEGYKNLGECISSVRHLPLIPPSESP